MPHHRAGVDARRCRRFPAGPVRRRACRWRASSTPAATGRARRIRPPRSCRRGSRRPRGSSRCCRSAARWPPRSARDSSGRSGSPGSPTCRWRTPPRRGSGRRAPNAVPVKMRPSSRTRSALLIRSAPPRSSHGAYAARLSARNPVSISVPDGSRHRIARMPSCVSALPAIPRSVRIAVIDSSRYPDRACAGALQHDSLGVAGQHRLVCGSRGRRRRPGRSSAGRACCRRTAPWSRE